ncbi:hypothetical protein VTN77DRAFT_9293 [Rasamsonia byssochlamydoides]|uniref:uncharacterized protein n=1 Tax=Rasamsonia byssochlamydoides TaxID=89139 RepID=UPI003742A3D8
MATNQSKADQVCIRHARPEEVPLLAAVETSAATLFRTIHNLSWIADMPPMDPGLLHLMVSSNRVWVAVTSDNVPVAFSAAESKDSRFYIAELSVHRAWQRQGIATKLIAKMEKQAREEGFSHISLTTYRDLEWNGRFYAKLGFVEVEPAAAGVQHVKEIEAESQKGHDISRRCVMWKRLC